MTKYLTVIRAFNEPDNNTAKAQVWVKLNEYENSSDANMAEDIITREWMEDYEDVEVDTIPLDNIKDTWLKVSEQF